MLGYETGRKPRFGNRLGNRSGNGSGGGSECRHGPDFRRESGREIRRVSACGSRVECHGDSEV